jgi:hypothetical protein
MNPDPDTDPDPAFQVNPDPALFFYQNLQFTYAQATGEAFSPKKKHPAALKNYVCGSLLLWIRNH